MIYVRMTGIVVLITLVLYVEVVRGDIFHLGRIGISNIKIHVDGLTLCLSIDELQLDGPRLRIDGG